MALEGNIVERCIAGLRRNRIGAEFFSSKEDIVRYLDSVILDSSVVGVGDSMTLEALGLYDYLRKRSLVFLDKYSPLLTKEEKRELYIRNFSADFFLSSANAITTDGKIYNLDGNGSRVAPMIYGPSQVFIISGINKIVESDQDAVDRIKGIAAPLDAKRLGKKTPCSVTGRCCDCKSPQRICNYYTIIQGQFNDNRIKVLLADDILGY